LAQCLVQETIKFLNAACVALRAMDMAAQPHPKQSHLALSRIIVGRGILATHGFLGAPQAGQTPLDLEILARSIDFFERMCEDKLGAILVRRKSKSELRNMMHGENIRIPFDGRGGADVDEDELETRLVAACFGQCGYYGVGYVLGAFLALDLQPEHEMRRDPYGSVGPSQNATQAWRSCPDFEWVEAVPQIDCLGPMDGTLVRSPSASERAYPVVSYQGATGLPPPSECFLRVGSEPARGSFTEKVHYALRGSMRIVWPHVGASHGDNAAMMKLCLPIHFASGAEVVDVRMSYEFAVNPRGTPVDLPASDFASTFFKGRDGDELYLAFVADLGSASAREDLYIERGTAAVLSLLRYSENYFLKSHVVMYHSSKLDPVAVKMCKEAFERSSILTRWRAFKQQLQEDIFVYSCNADRPDEWLMGKEQVDAQEEIHKRKRLRLLGAAGL